MKYILAVACLVFLSACMAKPCQDGFVRTNLAGEPACIAASSYCENDDQCSAIQYDCATPCEWKPVNTLFASKAQNISDNCLRKDCAQVPKVERWCENKVCQAKPVYASELLPPPSFLEVSGNKTICYEVKENSTVLRLRVENDASTELSQLEMFYQTGGETFGAAILEEPLSAWEISDIRYEVESVPSRVLIFTVRPTQVQGMNVSMRNEDQVAVSDNIVAC